MGSLHAHLLKCLWGTQPQKVGNPCLR